MKSQVMSPLLAKDNIQADITSRGTEAEPFRAAIAWTNPVRCLLLATATLIILFLASATTANAGVVKVYSFDTGAYANTGFHNKRDLNYFAGANGAEFFHDFFAFDLPGFDKLTSAKLDIFNPPNGYAGPGTGLTLTLYDVTTPRDKLVEGYDSGSPIGKEIYKDLGTGAIYGSRLVTSADDNKYIEITLNRDAVQAILAAQGGYFAIGGALSVSDFNQGVFSGSGAQKAVLILDVPAPEPGSLLLFGSGVLGLAGILRHRLMG